MTRQDTVCNKNNSFFGNSFRWSYGPGTVCAVFIMRFDPHICIYGPVDCANEIYQQGSWQIAMILVATLRKAEKLLSGFRDELKPSRDIEFS